MFSDPNWPNLWIYLEFTPANHWFLTTPVATGPTLTPLRLPRLCSIWEQLPCPNLQGCVEPRPNLLLQMHKHSNSQWISIVCIRISMVFFIFRIATFFPTTFLFLVTYLQSSTSSASGRSPTNFVGVRWGSGKPGFPRNGRNFKNHQGSSTHKIGFAGRNKDAMQPKVGSGLA